MAADLPRFSAEIDLAMYLSLELGHLLEDGSNHTTNPTLIQLVQFVSQMS